MKSKLEVEAVPEGLSRRRRLLTLVIWVVAVCLSFGAYHLLVNALAHDGASEAHVPPRSLAAPVQEAVLKIDPASKSVAPGATFSVTVRIEDAVDPVGAFEFGLTYDDACIDTISPCDDAATLGPFLGSTGRSVADVGPTCGTGSITYGGYSWGGDPGPTGDGDLATITFQAGTSVCSSDLHFQNVTVLEPDGSEIPTSAEDGQVRVSSGTAPEVTDITPDWGHRGQTVEDVIVQGENFQEGASVELTKSGESPISASMPEVQSSTRISCTFNLGKAGTGKWTVKVTNPDGRYGELPDGFTVKTAVYLPLAMKNY